MALKFFTVLLHDPSSGELELNSFLASHRVLGVERQFVNAGANSLWSICVDYIPTSSGTAASALSKKPRVDYRETLPPHEFALFARLRELRKQLAQSEAVPVYMIFTNEQLAEMVRRQLRSTSDLETIVGVGDGRVSKYGPAFVSVLIATGANHEAIPGGP